MVSALLLGADGPFNVVGPGAASVWQAVRLGGRVPWPVFGPGWRIAKRVVELAGAPMPPHILELMTKGRTADGSKAVEQLGLTSIRPTQEVCTELFEWAMVTPLRPSLPLGGGAVTSPNIAPSNVTPLPVYGVDTDRTQTTDLVTVLRRRFEGRYPVDEFGADPQLQDLIAPFVTTGVRVDVTHPERLPEAGPAVLVSNRGLGVVEPAALSVALRQESGRRLRIIGAPDVPVFGDLMRKLGAVMSYSGDLAALLRADHVAALPLGPTWLRTGTGAPPIQLLVAALGYPVIPVAVRPGGPFGLPIRPWRVIVGEPLPVRAVRGSGDPLAAAELAEAAREGVLRLLDSDA